MPIDKTSGLFKWVAKTMSPRNRAAGEAFWKVIKTCCAVFIFQPWFCFLCAPLSCPGARQAPGESSPKHTRAKKRGLMMLLDEPHTQKIPSRCWGHFGGLVGGFRDIFEEILGLFFFFPQGILGFFKPFSGWFWGHTSLKCQKIPQIHKKKIPHESPSNTSEKPQNPLKQCP